MCGLPPKFALSIAPLEPYRDRAKIGLIARFTVDLIFYVADQLDKQALIYLVPAVSTAFVMRMVVRRVAIMATLMLIGTACHELCHFVLGLLTGAKPVSFSLIPIKIGPGLWILGSVRFTRLTWLNSAVTAMAPLLLLPGVYFYSVWRVGVGNWVIEWSDFLIWGLVLAPIFNSCWPSAADWRLAVRSWPIALALFFFLAWCS